MGDGRVCGGLGLGRERMVIKGVGEVGEMKRKTVSRWVMEVEV